MCGIAGWIGRGRDPGGVSPGEAARSAEAMAARLRHRGPDRASHYVSPSGRCVLAHTRLAIIDLQTGDQPLPNEDGSIVVVFNGEIYNFERLRTELLRLGHRFRSRSDTEVIVHGYEAWGDGVVERLDGMFAFALWDERRSRLVLARDRVGKKPLFLQVSEDRLAFASEIKALLALPGADDTLDPRALPLYLAYGYVPTPGTFYRTIEKLPPATIATVNGRSQVERRRFWHLDYTPRAVPMAEAVARTRELVHAAVERRLVSDVPLGAFLSGGMDSSIVVGLMSGMVDKPVHTFSIGFSGDATYDETRYARLAAERYGCRHTEFMVGPQSVELVDRLVEAYDEPFGDSSAIPTYILSRLTREHVTVALNGDGGDEAFGGYLRLYGHAVAERIPRPIRRLGARIGAVLPHDSDFRSPTRRFTRFFEAASLPPEERMLRWIGFLAEEGESLLRPHLRGLLTRNDLTASFREPLEEGEGRSPLTRALALTFHTYLPDDLLVKADRASMAHGLELRSPLLDTAVLEMTAGLPDAHLIRRGRTKVLLRRAFADLLPPEILSRKKMGFGIPLPTWLRREWRSLLEDRILAPDARLWEWIEPEPVRRMAAVHLSGGADYGHQLWALLTLETWLRSARYALSAASSPPPNGA